MITSSFSLAASFRRVLSSLAPAFDRQCASRKRDTSLNFALAQSGVLKMATFFGGLLLPGLVTTAWAINPPVFSQGRGFYSNPFSLTLSVDPVDTSPTLRVRYTLDGKLPTPSVGQDFTAPISVTTTTVVRAMVYDSANPTTVSVAVGSTYIFLAHVIHQPVNIPTASDPNFANYPSYPRETYDVGNGKTAVHDYEMDPDVVNSPSYSSLILPSMQAIPTISLIADEAEMFGPHGFYDGDTERLGSMEVLYPNNPGGNQQSSCGIDPHSTLRLKRSLRLEFSSSFGASKLTSSLLQTAPVGGNFVTTKFDNIILRGGNNRSWARSWNPDATTYTEDEWFRQSQSAMNNGIGAHGTFVHLYINGLYWGLYNATERPDENFAATYTGGKKGDHFSLKEDGRLKGDPTRWNYLSTTLVAKDMTVQANYDEMKSYLEVGLFSDYLILGWYMGWNDWPHNNWWFDMRNDVPLPGRYYAWDGEWSWDRGNPFDPSIKGEAPNGAWVHPAFRLGSTDDSFQATFWRSLWVNADFRMTFADHVYSHLSDGALSDINSRIRWNALNLYVEDAIIAESARWGDALTPTKPRTRDVDWNREVLAIYNLMGGNAARFLNALRAQGYYPSINPPQFDHAAGNVAAGSAVALSNPNNTGAMYYKLDGTDPRAPGGALDPAAIAYGGPVVINSATTVKARVLNGSQWSALAVAQFSPTSANTPPNVSAVAPIVVSLPAGISLAGTASDDGLPGALTTSWTKVSGPGTVSFAAPGALATTATFSAQGSYLLRFSATDGELTTSKDLPVFVYPAGSALQSVDTFTLVDADTSNAIAGYEVIADGTVIDLGALPTRRINIRANTSPSIVGSVRFAFAGSSNFRTESEAPYALWGDKSGKYNPVTPGVGSYTLKGTPYTGASASGTVGIPLTVKFTVTDSGVADAVAPSIPAGLSADTFTPTTFTLHWSASTDNVGVTGYEVFLDGTSQGIVNATSLNIIGLTANTSYVMTVRARDAAGNWSDPSTGLTVTTPANNTIAVVSVTLINADTDLPVAGYDPIASGAVISRASLPTTHLNLRVNTSPVAVGSVRMKLDSAAFKVESVAPYAYFGDTNGNYNAGSISTASHTFSATPFTGSGATGTAGTALTITFKIQ